MGLPQITVNGRPNPQAMVLAAKMLIAIGNRNREESNRSVDGTGAREVFWRNNPNNIDVDFSIFRHGDVLWVNVHGTENPVAGWGGIQQVLAYLVSIFPAFEPSLGTYALGWVIGQGRGVLTHVLREVEREGASRIVVTGHSLGGAVAHVVSRLICNAFTPGGNPGLLERVLTGPVERVGAAMEGVGDFFGMGPQGGRQLMPHELRMTDRSAIPVDLLTFGEPRCIGGAAEYPPRSHWRIVGTGERGFFQDVDVVTLLPPNIAIVPGPGIVAGLPGVRRAVAVVGLGITPVHYGVPVYLTASGNVVQDPYDVATRAGLEIGLSVGALVAWRSISLHFLRTTYLPGALALAGEPERNAMDERDIYYERVRTASDEMLLQMWNEFPRPVLEDRRVFLQIIDREVARRGGPEALAARVAGMNFQVRPSPFAVPGQASNRNPNALRQRLEGLYARAREMEERLEVYREEIRVAETQLAIATLPLPSASAFEMERVAGLEWSGGEVAGGFFGQFFPDVVPNAVQVPVIQPPALNMIPDPPGMAPQVPYVAPSNPNRRRQ